MPRREHYQKIKNDYAADGNYIRKSKHARINEFSLPNLSPSIQIDGNQMQLKSNIEAYLPQHISAIPYITPKLSQLGSNSQLSHNFIASRSNAMKQIQVSSQPELKSMFLKTSDVRKDYQNQAISHRNLIINRNPTQNYFSRLKSQISQSSEEWVKYTDKTHPHRLHGLAIDTGKGRQSAFGQYQPIPESSRLVRGESQASSNFGEQPQMKSRLFENNILNNRLKEVTFDEANTSSKVTIRIKKKPGNQYSAEKGKKLITKRAGKKILPKISQISCQHLNLTDLKQYTPINQFNYKVPSQLNSQATHVAFAADPHMPNLSIESAADELCHTPKQIINFTNHLDRILSSGSETTLREINSPLGFKNSKIHTQYADWLEDKKNIKLTPQSSKNKHSEGTSNAFSFYKNLHI